jgi:hypothetical protein
MGAIWITSQIVLHEKTRLYNAARGFQKKVSKLKEKSYIFWTVLATTIFLKDVLSNIAPQLKKVYFIDEKNDPFQMDKSSLLKVTHLIKELMEKSFEKKNYKCTT